MATSTDALIDILTYVKTWKSPTFKIEAYEDILLQFYNKCNLTYGNKLCWSSVEVKLH